MSIMCINTCKYFNPYLEVYFFTILFIQVYNMQIHYYILSYKWRLSMREKIFQLSHLLVCLDRSSLWLAFISLYIYNLIENYLVQIRYIQYKVYTYFVMQTSLIPFSVFQGFIAGSVLKVTIYAKKLPISFMQVKVVCI